jgi:methionine-gamma-lyase
VETVLAALEGAEAAMLAGSGMGAISVAVLSLVEQGTHLVAQTYHYGGTPSLLRDLLPRFGVQVTQVDQRDTQCANESMNPRRE